MVNKEVFEWIRTGRKFFHHLAAKGVIEMDEKSEEKGADSFAKEIMAKVKMK